LFRSETVVTEWRCKGDFGVVLAGCNTVSDFAETEEVGLGGGIAAGTNAGGGTVLAEEETVGDDELELEVISAFSVCK